MSYTFSAASLAQSHMPLVKPKEEDATECIWLHQAYSLGRNSGEALNWANYLMTSLLAVLRRLPATEIVLRVQLSSAGLQSSPHSEVLSSRKLRYF